jgi:trimethylamine--corrinoid protein Co-methyltransferase
MGQRKGGIMMDSGTRAGYSQISGCGLNLFSDAELAELHRATLDVMENTGIMVMNDEAQDIFYSHGCRIDRKSSMVKMPGYLIEEAIKSAPSKVLLAGRNPEYDVVLEGTRVANTNFGSAVKVLDLETGQRRDSTLKDLVDAAKLCDAADGADTLHRPLTPRDVPPELETEYGTETCLSNCSKHFCIGTLSAEGVRRFFEMGVAVAGGEEEMRERPPCSLIICPVSPLQLSHECCEVIIESARLGIVCNVLSMALSGATAPVTSAGTLIVHNAEVLGGITLSQLTGKGAPVIYGSSTTMFDLKCVTSPVGAPEMGLISAAVAKLAQYYNLPSYVSGT